MIEGKKKKKEREIVRLITQVGNFIDHPVDVCNGVYLTVHARP